jgi:hypothetical protein
MASPTVILIFHPFCRTVFYKNLPAVSPFRYGGTCGNTDKQDKFDPTMLFNLGCGNHGGSTKECYVFASINNVLDANLQTGGAEQVNANLDN